MLDFAIIVVFHKDTELLKKTLPQALKTLTEHTSATYEVILVADGSDIDTVQCLISSLDSWRVDELRFRRRWRNVASGAPSNNAHLHQFKVEVPYLIILEDDVLLFKSDPDFDILQSSIALFERHPQVPVIFKMSDHDQWKWKLRDLAKEIEPGVRSVNRVSTHFNIYHTERFYYPAREYGGFNVDVFIDRDDISYNWEDMVSHVGTTGGREIAFPECWPIMAFHCDRKISPDSMYNTQSPEVKLQICNELLSRQADLHERGKDNIIR